MTDWSSRLLAARMGIERSTVTGISKEYGVKPSKAETFSTDPELEAKVVDVVGLYLAPTGERDRAVRG